MYATTIVARGQDQRHDARRPASHRCIERYERTRNHAGERKNEERWRRCESAQELRGPIDKCARVSRKEPASKAFARASSRPNNGALRSLVSKNACRPGPCESAIAMPIVEQKNIGPASHTLRVATSAVSGSVIVATPCGCTKPTIAALAHANASERRSTRSRALTMARSARGVTFGPRVCAISTAHPAAASMICAMNAA